MTSTEKMIKICRILGNEIYSRINTFFIRAEYCTIYIEELALEDEFGEIYNSYKLNQRYDHDLIDNDEE